MRCCCSWICGLRQSEEPPVIMTDRAFDVTFPEYNNEPLLQPNGKLIDDAAEKLTKNIEEKLVSLERALRSEVDPDDTSVYTGTTGIALLYIKLSEVFTNKSTDYLKKALALIEPSLKHLRQRKLSYLGGDAGPLATAAVVYNKLGKHSKSKECLAKLFLRADDVIHSKSIPDEFLYGRVGYLFSLLCVQHHIGKESVDSDLISKVYGAIIESGQRLSSTERSPMPLSYEWHEKKYMGAAHGFAGILYILILAHDMNGNYSTYLEKLVQPTLNLLMEQRFPSGNYPSSFGSTGDKLIHWCHGAPGWIYTFILAYKVFNDDKYKSEAISCGEVIWRRGLLKKGYGICHGVSGNAYAFLSLYRFTGDLKYLHRALKFADWCCDYGKHDCRTPDRPFSLFEGLAGTIYFLADLLQPSNSRFPAYEL